MYTYDASTRLSHRVAHATEGIEWVTLGKLQTMMLAHKPFVRTYRRAAELLRESGDPAMRMALWADDQNPDRGRYNAPLCLEVAAILPGTHVGCNRDVVLHLRESGLRFINETHRLCDPLTYPLLYPTGCEGPRRCGLPGGGGELIRRVPPHGESERIPPAPAQQPPFPAVHLRPMSKGRARPAQLGQGQSNGAAIGVVLCGGIRVGR